MSEVSSQGKWGPVLTAFVRRPKRFEILEEPDCSGKWLVYVPAAQGDGPIERIRQSVLAKRLDSMKVSNGPFGPGRSYVVCVYCRDSRPETVRKALRELRRIGVQGPLDYKSDTASFDERTKGRTAGARYLYRSADLEA